MCALLNEKYGRPLMANLIYAGTFALPTEPGTYVVGATADNSSTLIISLDIEGHYCVNLSHRPPMLLAGAAILRSFTTANGVLYLIDDSLSDGDPVRRMSMVKVLADIFPDTYSLSERAEVRSILNKHKSITILVLLFLRCATFWTLIVSPTSCRLPQQPI